MPTDQPPADAARETAAALIDHIASASGKDWAETMQFKAYAIPAMARAIQQAEAAAYGVALRTAQLECNYPADEQHSCPNHGALLLKLEDLAAGEGS